MNRKFRVNNYEVVTNFKNDNNLYIAVEDIETQQYFLNETVELMRIKKDTVFATLQKKSEKNLRCQFEQIVDEKSRYLVIIFIVSFDFLPQFRQEIKLEFVEKKNKLRNISTFNFQVQVQELEKIVNNFDKNGIVMHRQVGSVNLNEEKQIWTQEVNSGKYLLKLSGIYTNNLGNNVGVQCTSFTIKQPQRQSTKIRCAVHSLSGYSYPFNFSHIADCSQGDLKVLAHQGNQNITLSNVCVTLTPISSLN